jgi:type IV pilus assembly protein PilM
MINFNKKSVGLNIADHTIEVVELEKIGREIKISSLARIILEPGVVERGRIKNEEKLAQAVKDVLVKARPNAIKTSSVIFGLPESQVYIHVFNIAAADKKNIEAAVLSEAQSTIPLKEQDLLYAYRVLNNTKSIKESVEILLVATSRQVILEWQQFFEKINLAVELFDIEALATFRGLFNKLPEEPIGLLDLGAATTNLSIFTSAGLRYSYSIKCAGQDFTGQIAQELKIDFKEAEKLKIQKGLGENQNQSVNTILKKSLEKIVDEIKINIDYWQKNNSQEIKEIILLGGSSQMSGLASYFNSLDLGFKAKLAKPVYQLMSGRSTFKYIEAIGLALRGLDNKWSRIDPCISGLENTKGELKAGRRFEGAKKIPINIFSPQKWITIVFLICFLLFCLSLIVIFYTKREDISVPEDIFVSFPAPKEIMDSTGTTTKTEELDKQEESLAPNNNEETDVSKTDFLIKVLNGSGQPGLAAKMASRLKQEGYKISSLGNADNFNYFNTTIKYKTGSYKQAELLSKLFSAQVELEEAESQDIDIIIILGENFE